jgi:hypothetical protein
MKKKNPVHYFCIEDAMAYGVDEAIMLYNIRYWVELHEATKSKYHYHNGKYWIYNTKKAFSQLFPYWTEKQVRRILTNLLNLSAIESGNFNTVNYDQTLWYTLTDDSKASEITIGPNGLLEWPKQSNPIDQMGQPIPDNKQHNKQHNNLVSESIDHSPDNESIINKKTGVSKSEIKFIPEEPINYPETDNNSPVKKKSVVNIPGQFKTQAKDDLEKVEYLFKLTRFQILNPKHPDVVSATHNKVKLTRIPGDIAVLFKSLCRLHHPGIFIEEVGSKDYIMLSHVMKKIDGDLKIFRKIIINWAEFKSVAEDEYKVKIKNQYPNLPIMAKYATIATSSVFLDQFGGISKEKTNVNKMTLDKALKG